METPVKCEGCETTWCTYVSCSHIFWSFWDQWRHHDKLCSRNMLWERKNKSYKWKWIKHGQHYVTPITKEQTVGVHFIVGHEYLLTSLASLAIKNPKVPSCIFTWFPGLIRILFNEKEMIMLVNRNLIFLKFTIKCSNQEEWYTRRPSGSTDLHWTTTRQTATLYVLYKWTFVCSELQKQWSAIPFHTDMLLQL